LSGRIKSRIIFEDEYLRDQGHEIQNLLFDRSDRNHVIDDTDFEPRGRTVLRAKFSLRSPIVRTRMFGIFRSTAKEPANF
jgi:hypothetical protein